MCPMCLSTIGWIALGSGGGGGVLAALFLAMKGRMPKEEDND